jgi:gliding motility-associated-like protein
MKLLQKMFLAIALMGGMHLAAQVVPATGTSFNDCPVFVATAFTPNGDGINDQFGVVINPNCTPQSFSFRVFDRWGRLVFDSASPLEEFWWNGTYDGTQLNGGVYLWRLQAIYQQPDGSNFVELNKTGSVVLVR